MISETYIYLYCRKQVIYEYFYIYLMEVFQSYYVYKRTYKKFKKNIINFDWFLQIKFNFKITHKKSLFVTGIIMLLKLSLYLLV